jgi:two-component system CheB/CheR fusion protein
MSDPLANDVNDKSATPDADGPSRVVGIGASAGGLEAVSELLKYLPSNTGMAFVFRERNFLLLFEDSPLSISDVTSPKAKKGRRTLQDARVSQLEQEVATSREHLQTLIEEQESTNEELHSGNEEIQSSNEELQSTNDELETAKEELQSTNEELITLNEELKSGNLELTEVNNDLMNLLKSVNIPIVMVDRGLRIRRFTPVAQRTLKLISADVGRMITDLRADIEVSQLDAMISEVMESLTTQEVEVQDRKGHW